MATSIRVKAEDIAAFHEAAMKSALRETGKPIDMPSLYAPSTGDTPGDLFVRSQAFADWRQRFPEGGPSGPGQFFTDPVPVGGMRTLITAADTSAGTLVKEQHRGLVEPRTVRPLRVRDLLTVQSVSTDTVEYAAEKSRVQAAAPVAEATALTGTSGTKPEGGLEFELKTAVVRTFAVWTAATKRILSDASELRRYVDDYLTSDLALELEDQVIAGSGTGENFTGVLNTPGIIAVGAPGAGESVFDTLRQAIRRIRLEGRTEPNAIVLHPADAEQVDLLKVNSEVNHFAGSGPFGAAGPRIIWGLPVVETDALPENTGLVADFRKAVLFDREQATVSVGVVGDDFIRNLVRVLCEARAAFTCLRVKAFATVSM